MNSFNIEVSQIQQIKQIKNRCQTKNILFYKLHHFQLVQLINLRNPLLYTLIFNQQILKYIIQSFIVIQKAQTDLLCRKILMIGRVTYHIDQNIIDIIQVPPFRNELCYHQKIYNNINVYFLLLYDIVFQILSVS
ncbi:unnamed protein product [Paramecium octaurelia]|uniref:Uncharacterized protein n=1 Tax=Paramecium octaurelia TaxID=43137 RepID=A0A8S1RWE8_PAROT|nr:unnamed protein product [Paramecium octaurelia]